jgi:hypothetical protein
MTSLIDSTKPVYGNPTTQSVRDNFLHAYDEITDLQSRTALAPFLPTAGGLMNGPITMQTDPLNPMEVATKRYVDDIVFGGSGTVPDAPTDGMYYARGYTVGGNTWSHDPLFASVHIGPNSATDRFRIGSDATYNFIKFSPGNDFLRYNPTNNTFGIVRNNIVVQSWTATDAVLTIPLTLPGNPTIALHAAPKQYVDAQIAAASYVKLAGDTMTGALTLVNQLKINAVSDARVSLYSSGAAADSKYFDMFVGPTGSFYMQLVNDAFNAGDNFLTVSRTGYNVSSLTLDAPTISLVGEVNSSANINAAGDVRGNAILPGAIATNYTYALYADATYRYIRFTVDNWRLLFNASNGILSYDHPSGAQLFHIDSGGNTWQAGGGSVTIGHVYRSFSGNWIGFGWDGAASALNYYIDGGFVNTVASRGWCNDIFATYTWVNTYFKPASAYTPDQSVNYNSSPTFWTGTFSGDISAAGSVGGISWQMKMGSGGSGRILQLSPSWYWDWNVNNGDMQWVTPNGPSLVLGGDRNSHFHGGSVYVNGSRIVCLTNNIGISYNSGAYNSSNTFLMGWSNLVGSLVTISIDNGGAAYAIANASDERLKLDIQPSTFDALATVNKIPLFEYDWLEMDDPWKLKEARVKSTKSPLNLRSRIGIIAQRLREVFPEGVNAGDDFDDHLGRVWGLDQNVMIALLLGSIKQLTTRIEQLETRQ